MSIATQVHTAPLARQRRSWNVRPKWAAAAVVSLVLVAVAVWWQTKAVPNSLPAEFSKAWELLEEGRIDAAEKLLDALMRQQQHGNAYLVLDAALSVAHKDFEGAESRIQAANLKGALRPYALEVLGKSFFGRQRWYDAERVFRTLANEIPRSFTAHLWLGMVYDDLHMFGQAIHELMLAAEIQPTDYRPHILHGSILNRYGRYQKAAEQYQQALRLMPPDAASNITSITYFVNCLVRDGQFDVGLEKIAAVSDPSVELRVLRAECFLGLGQLAEAAHECRTVLEHDENQQAAVIMLAKVGMQQTATSEHAQLLEAALARNSNDSEVMFLLAQVHGRLGNQQRQQELLTQSQRLVKLQIRSRELLEDIWSQAENVDARLKLADICDELGESKQAKQWRQAAAGCQQRIKALQGNAP